MMYCTVRGSVLKVGGISEASRAPRRPETGGDYVDGAGDLRQSTPDSGGDGGILVVHEADEFQRRFAVEVGGSRVGFFSREDAEIRLWLARAGQLLRLSFNWEVGRHDWKSPLPATPPRNGAPTVILNAG
jgi:hypothetical protein